MKTRLIFCVLIGFVTSFSTMDIWTWIFVWLVAIDIAIIADSMINQLQAKVEDLRSENKEIKN